GSSVLLTSSPSNSLGASFSTTVAAGTYYLVARSRGDYGDMGQYTITGSVPVGPPPEIEVTAGGAELIDGQSVDFGSTNSGQPVTRVITVTNVGGSALALTPLNPASLPAGFSLIANLGNTSLAAGQATQFSVGLDAAAFGTFGGGLQLLNNDSDESPFDLVLSGTVLAPEVTIRLGGENLIDGQTIEFGVTPVGDAVTRTLTVTNDGNDTLTLTPLDPAGLPPGFTLVSNVGGTSLAPGQSTSFSLQFDAASAGSFGGNVALSSSDSDENPFDLVLSASAYVPAPEITALVAGQPLALGGLVDFGATVPGVTLERTITIRNDGTAALNLTPLDPASLPAGFSLYQDLSSTVLEPGQTTSFILRLDAAAVGEFGGTVTLGNSDSDEGPFTFAVGGSVAPPPPPFKAIVDDGNAGSTLSGAWSVVSGKGYGNDIRTANRGTGTTAATWTFNGLATGQYQAWATWKIASTNATNAPFTIFDNTTSRGTTLVNQQLTPSGLSADGALWKSLGVVTINSGRMVVRLTNAANNKVVADAIRIERVGVQGPAPEIGVSVGGYQMTSGQSSISFGTREIGSPLTYSFVVSNHGAGSLQLTALDPLALPAGFSLVQNFGSTFLTPGESTTFSLRLDAGAAGSCGGALVLANNDADESLFSFNVSGSVVDPNAPFVQIIDEGAAGNTLTGTWTAISGKGYANDMRTAAAGSGSIQSNWTFSGLADGQYQVWATWRIGSTYATNAPFRLYNGNQLVATTAVNQRLTPTGLWDGTTLWQSLGAVSVVGSQLGVRLTNAANGQVVADAIRIERVPSGAAPITSQKRLGGESLAAWLSASLATASSHQIAEQREPQAALPALTAWKSPADLWARPKRTSPEESLLASTLELLSSSRSTASAELATALQAAADQLALAALDA
ncbi:MAG TPA: choice-of-anchor D domain-containing protein, partial [Pirellulaceae bacterium]|nr:choice-of-anchor D domain-containing protein [Pirellulaceae bacterium]